MVSGIIWDVIEALQRWWFVPPTAAMPDLPWVAKLTPGAASAIKEAIQGALSLGYMAGVRDAAFAAFPIGLVMGLIVGIRIADWTRSRPLAVAPSNPTFVATYPPES